MRSTPLDKYEGNVDELAKSLAKETGPDYSKKKNQMIFPREREIAQDACH
jgi:hypothetical protein